MDVKLKTTKMEIKKNELRIGNIVSWNGEIAVISQLLERDISFKCGEECLYEDIKPIQLTKEVLLRCGAKEVQAKRGVLKEFVLKTVRIEMSNSGNFYYKHSKTDLQYLHRLQNLFHSLRNEELTYNHSQSI